MLVREAKPKLVSLVAVLVDAKDLSIYVKRMIPYLINEEEEHALKKLKK